MWSVFKIDQKKINLLKEDFRKLLGDDIIFYNPKIVLQNYKKNKLFSKEYSLLGDYIFCYHSKFNCVANVNLIKFSRGLKYFLPGSLASQEEIKDFIENCKNSEDKNGNLTTSFFKYNLNTLYKFKSGPLTEKLFKIIEIQKNKIKILLGSHKTTVNKNDFLFYPV